jgi:transcription elongation GreA/GreB family factor
MPSKILLKAELVAALEATLTTLEAAYAAAREGATHEEAKPENDKDTRALEQSYLARGQAMRIEVLKTGLAAVHSMNVAQTDVARAGSLVEAEDDDGRAVLLFLAPEGGGLKLTGGVQVVTPPSPLGAALLGKRAGDEAEVSRAGSARQLAIVKVS